MVKRGKKPRWQIEIAKERIKILFNLAKSNVDAHPERARRYIEIARKIGLRYNIRFDRQKKKSFCKKCNTPFIVGKTCIYRLDSKRKTLNIICKNCGNIIRNPYKGRKNGK
ncbi:MAG: ribonuclease P [Candidatus Aenigmarchaeota archaeon]|nr:ribonuclease P [Candidatus Aenigmarchaeota archaeon]